MSAAAAVKGASRALLCATALLAGAALVPPGARAEGDGPGAAAGGPSEARRSTPTFGLELGRTGETLTLERANGASDSDARSLWNTRLSVGLLHRFRAPFLARGALLSQSELGVGVVYDTGHWPIHLRQTFTWEVEVARHFALRVGPGTGFDLDVTDPAFSSWSLGVAWGLRWGPAVLVWFPHLAVPLGAERETVYGGTLEHRVSTGLVPLQLMLRFQLAGLSF